MPSGRRIGRYELYEPFASGGMASVHYGVELTDDGARRIVAMKRVEMNENTSYLSAALIGEAKIAARLKHPNVIAGIELLTGKDEVIFVMEYVDGPSLSTLVRRTEPEAKMPLPIAIAIFAGALRGLHALHVAVDEDDKPLQLVHRDVSPQNILVANSGIAKVTDFGISKGNQTGPGPRTVTGQIKGKLRYLSPEQVHGVATPRSDVFAMGVTAWEILVGKRLFTGESDAEVLASILVKQIPSARESGAAISEALDQVIARALARDPEKRFASAEEMADALEAAVPPASVEEVAKYVADVGGDITSARATRIAALRSGTLELPPRAAPILETKSALATTLATPPSTAKPRTAPKVWIAALAIPAILALGIASQRHAPETTPTESIAHEPDPISTPATTLPSSSPMPLPPSTANDGLVDPRLPPQPPPPNPVPPAAAPITRSTPRASPVVRSNAQANCKPPYVVDAQGEKHFKRECF